MNTSKLSTLLENAQSSGIILSDPPPKTGPWDKEAYIVENVYVEKDVEKKLLETMKEIPELSVFDGKLLRLSTWGVRVELQNVAKWLLYSTRTYGVEQTLNSVNKYIELGGIPFYEVQLVSGIETHREIQLTDEIRLVPYAEIPECWQKDQFSPSLYKFPYNKYCAQAAIVREGVVSPADSREELSDICEILTIVGPSAPYPTVRWAALKEPVPVKLRVGYAAMYENIFSYTSYKYNLRDQRFAKNIVGTYLLLEEKIRDSLLLSLKRLNAAQRGKTTENIAIDLGIALEILLLQDYNERDPISFPFRLRGAWFLGKATKRRKFVYDLLKAIYECRCKAVHSGKLKKHTYKVCEEDMSLDRLFKEGFKLCAELITKIIKENKFPDWARLILKLPEETLDSGSSPA